MKNFFMGEWFADLCMLECVLNELEFYSGSERKKMVNKHPKDGGSMLYGLTWRQRASYQKQREYDEFSGMFKTKIYEEEPELKEIFKEFSDIYFPDFEYLQLQLNKNFKCKPHRDSRNAGTSILVSLGDYTGGNTLVEQEDGNVVKYDSREKFVKFNGSKYLHWVEDFVGDRYSLVFFSNGYLANRIAKRNALALKA